MYQLVRSNGARWLRFDYRSPGTRKRNTLSLGTYPDVNLCMARGRRYEARKLLADGIDPRRQAQGHTHRRRRHVRGHRARVVRQAGSGLGMGTATPM